MVREIREVGDRSSVEVSDANRKLQLTVTLPLLTWSLSTEPGAGETDTRVGRLVIDDEQACRGAVGASERPVRRCRGDSCHPPTVGKTHVNQM